MSLTTDDAPPALVQPALAPGTIVAERYRIEARLGAGGSGTVFRCIDQRLNAVVALKVVASDTDVERLRREVAMARQITDRNVCRVHDLGETAELRFVTMELVEGESLRSKIRPDLPAAEARALIEQLIAGVAAIHAAGVVHRDLKPENVVVTPDGRAVIVDFGLAKSPSSASRTVSMRSGVSSSPNVTHAGVAVGTPRYMSPEQAAGEPVDARTDVWSLGLVAHELLTGAMPELDAEGPMPSPAVDQRWPGLAAVLRGCFALDPAGRFTDARTLGSAIAQGSYTPNPSSTRIPKPAPTSTPSQVPPPAHVPVPVPARARSRWPLVVAAVGVSAMIGFVVVRAVRGRSGGTGTGSGNGSEAPPGPRVLDATTKMQQLTTTTAKQWPEQAPTSVALDPTATKIAYTTGDGKLYVRALAGGAPVEWSATVTRRDRPQPLGAPRVIGWFSDGAIAVIGTTSSAMHLIRVRADGISDPLHESTLRFRAAVSPKGRIAISSPTTIQEPDGKSLGVVPSGAEVVALAWSADGKLAAMRVAGPAAAIDVDGVEIWRGRSQLLIDPLLAFAGPRIAFSFRDRDRTSIALIDPATRKVAVHEELAGHVGAGNAVNDTLVLVRGTTREAVQIRDRFATRALIAHADDARGSHVAGWTAKGAAVFQLDDRVVRATAGANSKALNVEPWPGTQAADIPTAVVGDDVVVRREEGDAWVLERVTANGTRTKLGRFEHASALQCRATCVLQQRDGAHVAWTDFDPSNGALGKLVHRSRDDRAQSFAMSPDDTKLALVNGTETIVIIDRATGGSMGLPGAAISTRWASVAFEDSGELWATAVALDAHPFGLVRFRNNAGSFSRSVSTLVTKPGDALRWFAEPAIRGADRDLRIAVATQELRLEIWRADGL